MRDDHGRRFLSLLRERKRTDASVRQALLLPGVNGLRVPAALRDVVGCTEESEVEMVVVRVARLAGQRLESPDRSGRCADCSRMREEQGSDVLRHVDVLELRQLAFDEGAKKEPGSRNVEGQGDVVVGVGEIAEVDPSAARIEEGADALDRLAVRSELVEKRVDIAPALMRAMAGDRAA